MKISFGNTKHEGVVTLHLGEENVHFIFLVGEVGSGKSFFHRQVYRDFIGGRVPREISFLFLDVPGRDAMEWSHSPYLFSPVKTEPEEAMQALEEVAAKNRDNRITIPGHDPILVIHIEEDALLNYDRERLEKSLEEILRHKETNNTYVFYSTSRVNRKVLAKWRKHFIDLLVVFRLRNAEDALFLTGDTLTQHFSQPGEHLVLWRGRKIHCAPFPSRTEIL